MNPEIQPTSPLDLAGLAVATPAAGLVKMKEPVCLGVVLIHLACVSTRLSWVLEKIATSVEKQSFYAPPWWEACGFKKQIMNPEIQPTSPLDLAGVAVATPAAGLVKMKVLVCLGVALICLACVGTRLSWV